MTLPLRRFSAILSAVFAGLFLSGFTMTACAQACRPAHAFQTIRPGTLSVSAYDYPPYSIPSGNQDVSGVEGEIVKLIAARECLKISVSIVDPAAAIQSVIAGKADIGMGDWYRTADRAKVLGLSVPMYLDQMGIISKQGIDTVGALIGKRVGVIQADLWTGNLQKLLGAALIFYPTQVAMAQDLGAGRIDVGVASYAMARFNEKKGGYRAMKIMPVKPDARVLASLRPGQAALPYTKSNPALGDALNADIAALHRSGDIARILKAYGLSPSAGDVGAARLIQ